MPHLKHMNVGIIGAGAIGQAIAHVIRSKRRVTVTFWDKDTTKIPDQRPLAEIVQEADFLFLCVPSAAVRSLIAEIKSDLRPTMIVISVSKGLEVSTHLSVDQIFQELLPASQPVVMLCGPMLADEISQDLSAMAVVGTVQRPTFTQLKKLFKNTSLRVEYNRDIHGVAIASVLKNIYASGVGIGEGLGYGDNFRGWFISQAIMESAQIIKILGGKATTAYGTAGLGDLIATAMSPYSRNHLVGKELGVKGSTELTSEGLQSLPSVIVLLGDHMAEFPLLAALQKIILEKQPAQAIFESIVR